MIRTRAWRGLGGLLTATALVAAACGSGGSTSGGGSTVTFWIQSADPFIAAHKKVIAEYEKANPGQHVKLVALPFADFQTRLVASLPNGTGPDAAEGYAPWMTGAIRSGQLAAVPSSYLSTKQVENRYFEATLPTLKFKDTYYALPANLAAGSTRVLLSNDAVVAKAGVKLPGAGASFAQWEQAWKSLTKTNGSKVSVEGLGQTCGQPGDQFLSYLLEYGGSLLSADQKKANIDTPQGKSALTLLTQLTTKDHVDSASITDANCIPQGSAATGYRGTWVTPAYATDFPNFKGSYHLLPLPPGATSPLWQGGSGWATFVPAKSSHQDAAWKFLTFLDQHRQEWIAETGEIPAIKTLAVSVAKSRPQLYGAFASILDQSRNEYSAGDYFTIYGYLADMYTSVVQGKASVDQALKTAQGQIDSHLSQWWSQYPE